MKRNALFAAVTATTLGVFSLLAGCGGGDDDPNAGLPILPIASPSPVASAYAGTYSSTVALPEGRTGTVALTVGTDNRATGTLTVTQGGIRSRQATAFSFAVGTYAITGTVDPTTGAFSMTGNVGGQSFTYNGTLPTPGNGNVGGSYTLAVGGQTYTGSFANPGVQPSPSPSPSPTPGVSDGGTQSLTFSNVTGTNANIDLTPFTNATFSSTGPGAGTDVSNDNEYLNISTINKVAGSAPTEKVRSLSIVLIREGGRRVATGDVFDHANTGEMRTRFEQLSLAPFLLAERQYEGRIGTVTVVSRTATSITVRVNGLRMSNFDTSTNTANTFTVDGEITAPIKP